ncbi:MAG TPA: AAA family ATPase, partial [Galbitalea sp.]
GMFPQIGTGFWYGKRWTGKSLAVDVELALAVANGTQFMGRDVIQGTVIVGLGEGLLDAGVRAQARLAREQADRIAKTAEAAVLYGDEVAMKWFKDLPPYTNDNLKYETKAFTLPVVRDDGEAEISRSMQSFINRAKKYDNLALVILDALPDFTGSLSISNDTSANRAMMGLKTLASELDCFVVVVAHPTEDGKKMLGAGRLGNAADVIVRSVPETDTDGDNRMVSTVTCEKNKYGKRFEPFSYIVKPCEYYQDVLDDNDEPTGETELVETATIRLLDDEQDELRPRRRKRPLPRLVDSSAPPRKRNGVLRSVAGRF